MTSINEEIASRLTKYASSAGNISVLQRDCLRDAAAQLRQNEQSLTDMVATITRLTLENDKLKREYKEAIGALTRSERAVEATHDAVRDDLATAPEGAKAAGGTIHTPPWRRTRAYRVRQHPRYNMWEGTPRAPNNGLPQLVAPTLDELLAVISEALSV